MGKFTRTKQTGFRTVGYLRVSTQDQDLEKFKGNVALFANQKGFDGQLEFVEEKVSGRKSWRERKIGALIENLNEGDKIIVPELTRLGRSTLEVMDIIKTSHDKGIGIYSVKENFQLNGQDMQSKIMSTMLALFSEIERDFISKRTSEALQALKKKGVKLGRKKGPGKSKLDPHKEEIIALLKTGSRKDYIAKKYGVTPSTLLNFLKKRGLNRIEWDLRRNQR